MLSVARHNYFILSFQLFPQKFSTFDTFSGRLKSDPWRKNLATTYNFYRGTKPTAF